MFQEVNDLYSRQLTEWEFARKNYEGLKNVTIKTFQISRHRWHVQFNPKRIVSSAAKIDPKSLSERPCFLCENNRPVEQEGIFRGEYLILLNPYPVFDRHFTIPTREHIPQRINGRFDDMLTLAKDLDDTVIIYNGPKCGASAPDHLHFQSIPGNLLPVETAFPSIFTEVAICGSTTIYRSDDFLSHPVTIAGSNKEEISAIFGILYQRLNASMPQPDEPMINVLAMFRQHLWIIHVFPRRNHRPVQYYAGEPGKILISPGSIDMGGVLVMPREEDYNKVKASDIISIMEQVCMDEDFIISLINEIKTAYDSI